MKHDMSRRNALTILGKLTLLSACGGTSSPNPTPTPVTYGPAAGLSADRPVFVFDKNGVYDHPWGGGGYWPEQIFWRDTKAYADNLANIHIAAAGVEANGKVPLMGEVAWGMDLLAANGGDGKDIGDFRQRDGFKQYAAWMNPRAGSYYAQTEDGVIAYPLQAYISFPMPMMPADGPASGTEQTFGEWAGERVGNLAVYLNCRGVYAADFFIGVNYYTDWHPRLIDSFEKSAGVTVPGATVKARHDYLVAHYQSRWYDFICARQGGFFATIGKTIQAAGKVPLVGGQIPNDPAWARFFGIDPRVWSKLLPGNHWIFNVEVQSAGDRNPPPDWTAGIALGMTACRSPDVAVGVIMDADIKDFWDAAARVGWNTEMGWRYLKHAWLAAGWTHIANANGSVRRAPQCFIRSFWDAGKIDQSHLDTILGHIPKHPFGPAIYYSVNIEKTFEAPPPPNTDTPNHYYLKPYLQRSIGLVDATDPRWGVAQGLNLGYWVSDAVDLTKLAAADKPSAWLMYDSDRLPVGERARLEAIAPVIDIKTHPAQAVSAGPVYTKGTALNMLSFIDQNGSVILMVSNSSKTASSGSLEFVNVSNGRFDLIGMLGTANLVLNVSANKGSVPIIVAARDTLVFEIPRLKWVGH